MKHFVVGTIAGVLLAGVAAIGVVGSARAQPIKPQTYVAVARITAVTSWKQISRPVDTYSVSAVDRNVVLRAEYQVTKTCMSRYGLAFTAPTWDRTTDDSNQNYRLYGLMDDAHARTLGYHAAESLPEVERTYSARNFPADYLNVLMENDGGGIVNGQTIPSGGCIAEARRAAHDEPDDLSTVPEKIGFEGWTRSNSDARVKAAFADWSACMSKSGYQYSTPADANNDRRWTGAQPSDEEKKVASADVDCKQETNLTGIRMAADSAYESSLIVGASEQLKALTATQRDQVSRARSILRTVGDSAQ